MILLFTAFIAGALFGIGLTISEMINPARVIGFLDVTGRWDPTLALVMGGALAVTMPLFPLVLRRNRPVWSGQFYLPVKSEIDRPLVLGAAIFGVGWGLAGFCPGPALAAMASGIPSVYVFVIAMVLGQWLAGRTIRQ
jgi:uncharacterized membrane protein YedE/YeeE